MAVNTGFLRRIRIARSTVFSMETSLEIDRQSNSAIRGTWGEAYLRPTAIQAASDHYARNRRVTAEK